MKTLSTTTLAWGALAIIAVAVALAFAAPDSAAKSPLGEALAPNFTLAVDGAPLSVVIAHTEKLRERGLSGYLLKEDEGMLFYFDEDGDHSFWMKDMLVPLDILWIAADGVVVHIEKDVAPDSYPQDFTSPTPARYVLEVAAGFSDAHALKAGTSVVTF